jgi:hypothetical protein
MQCSTNTGAEVGRRRRGEHNYDHAWFDFTGRQPIIERIADACNRVFDDLTRNSPSLDSSLHPLGERPTHVVCQRHYHPVN